MAARRPLNKQLEALKQKQKRIQQRQLIKAGKLLQTWSKNNFKDVTFEMIKIETENVFGAIKN